MKAKKQLKKALKENRELRAMVMRLVTPILKEWSEDFAAGAKELFKKPELEIKQESEPKPDNEPEKDLSLEDIRIIERLRLIEFIQNNPTVLIGKYKKINNCNMIIYNVTKCTNGSIYYDCKDTLNGAVILTECPFNPKFPIFNDIEHKDIFLHRAPFVGPETVQKQLDG